MSSFYQTHRNQAHSCAVQLKIHREMFVLEVKRVHDCHGGRAESHLTYLKFLLVNQLIVLDGEPAPERRSQVY